MRSRADLVSAPGRLRPAKESYRPGNSIKIVMQFLDTITPDEGLVLLLVGFLTLLACLGVTIWVLVN